MQRVLVLGRGGAGKSVLARRLGERLALPVVELDRVFWSASLEPLSLDEWRAVQSELAAQPAWVLDGDLGPYDDPEPRLARADTVVLLDLPLWRCALRALRRGPYRADFWRWLIGWRRIDKPRLLRGIAATAPRAQVVVLPGPRAIDRWLAGLSG